MIVYFAQMDARFSALVWFIPGTKTRFELSWNQMEIVRTVDGVAAGQFRRGVNILWTELSAEENHVVRANHGH